MQQVFISHFLRKVLFLRFGLSRPPEPPPGPGARIKKKQKRKSRKLKNRITENRRKEKRQRARPETDARPNDPLSDPLFDPLSNHLTKSNKPAIKTLETITPKETSPKILPVSR